MNRFHENNWAKTDFTNLDTGTVISSTTHVIQKDNTLRSEYVYALIRGKIRLRKNETEILNPL